ncbi:MAG TPA: class I SAM-dependent methyltransferase [Rhizomicrobium sp.]|jgi:ubiquinone/menaquinone biosynthesis C-methylase UbiE|nr:class I SAM-dependent methyltransferase [Rhizomicrobium sp.]
MASLKATIKPFIPAPILAALSGIRRGVAPGATTPMHGQDLDMYWTPEMAKILDAWGVGTVWDEIQYFCAGLEGKALDIACGTGTTIELLNRSTPALDVYGCDISPILIDRAIQRGIQSEKVSVMDATSLSYANKEFDYSYSIGSLEHFTEEGIPLFLKEADRVTRKLSFHMIPVSKSGRNEGWMKTHQSFHNNNTEWWMKHCRGAFKTVNYLPSRWKDNISTGIWLVCESK